MLSTIYCSLTTRNYQEVHQAQHFTLCVSISLSLQLKSEATNLQAWFRDISISSVKAPIIENFIRKNVNSENRDAVNHHIMVPGHTAVNIHKTILVLQEFNHYPGLQMVRNPRLLSKILYCICIFIRPIWSTQPFIVLSEVCSTDLHIGIPHWAELLYLLLDCRLSLQYNCSDPKLEVYVHFRKHRRVYPISLPMYHL